MIEKAYGDVKGRHSYTIEVIEEHEARHNPITKKETRPATVEIKKEDYDTLIKDIDFVQMFRDLLHRLIEMIKEIVGQLKENVVQQQEYKDLNRNIMQQSFPGIHIDR